MSSNILLLLYIDKSHPQLNLIQNFYPIKSHMGHNHKYHTYSVKAKKEIIVIVI